MKLVPLFDNVVIERDKRKDKSEGGLYLPTEEKPRTGTIRAVGPGETIDGKVIPVSVKVGDKVFFSAYLETTVVQDDKELIVCDQSSILAIVE